MKSKTSKIISVLLWLISLVLAVLIVLQLYKYFSSPEPPGIKTNIKKHENDIIWGSASAPVTIYVYSSYTCKYCTLFFEEVFPEIKENFIEPGHVELVLKLVEIPENPKIMRALQAVICVNKFGKLDKLHELLLYNSNVVFSNEFELLIDDYINSNPDIGNCLVNHGNYEYIRNNNKEFKENQFSGTPTFIIENKVYSGFRSYEKFEEIFQNAIEDATN